MYKTQQGMALILILGFILIISLISITLFNKIFMEFKQAENEQQFLGNLVTLENCLENAAQNIAKNNTALTENDRCMSFNCTHPFYPIDTQNLTLAFWQEKGIPCGANFIYTQFLDYDPKTENYFYEIIAIQANGMTISVVLRMNFLTHEIRRVSWRNF